MLRFCALDPVERVFLEDVARRGNARFAAVADGSGELTALCHLGTNVVPSGRGCGAFADLAARSGTRMLIGEAGAVSELWDAARRKLPKPREDRPGQPVYAIDEPPAAGRDRRAARDPGRPRAAAPGLRGCAPRGAGRRPAAPRPDRLPLAHPRADRGGPLVALGGGRRDPVQGRGVGLDAGGRAAATGVDGPARPPSRLCGACARRSRAAAAAQGTPTVCLFVRAENTPAIRLYESIGMRHVLDYRSVLL